MNRRGLAFTLPFALSVLVAASCREATEVTLDITYGDPCARLRGVAVVAASDALAAEDRATRREYTTVTTSCTDAAGLTSRVGTLSVTPGDGKTRAAITLVAGVDVPAEQCRTENQFKGCIVARRSFAFLAHSGPTFPIRLEPACKDVPCDAQTTCKKGKCVDTRAECNDDTCADTVPDGPADAGPPEASSEAATDGASDGPTLGDAADASVDADSPTLCPPGPNAPRVCPPYQDPAPICAMNCALSGSGAMCSPVTGMFNASCTASRQCASAERCCWDGASNFSGCVAGPCGGRVLCRGDCDCAALPGTRCRTDAPGGPPFVKFCF